MDRVCRGSYYGSDWSVYTAEDQRACEESGGTVAGSRNSGCGSTTLAAAMPVGPESSSPSEAAEASLHPLRQVRNLFGNHEAVRAVLEANRLAGPEIERILRKQPDLQNELLSAFLTLTGLAKSLTEEPPPAGLFDKKAFSVLERAARSLSKSSESQEAQSSIDKALALAKPFVGMSLADVVKTLKGDQFMDHVSTLLPSSAVLEAMTQRVNFAVDLRLYGQTKLIEPVSAWAQARDAIERKAKDFGAGSPRTDMQKVPGGWRRRFEVADIYVGASGEAFEVHGAIREKYNHLGGAAGALGLPVTNEQGTPDGKGRFNHFEKNGSIYWTDTTGPFMVRGRVRQEWAARGWETGALGYPVRDQQAMPPLYPSDHPNLGWCIFQNGALFSIAGAATQAEYAEISPDQMRSMIRSFFDTALRAHDSHIGLKPNVELNEVSDWSYDFWAAHPRMVTFTLHGWRDLNDKLLGLGGVAPDPTFDLKLRLRFSTTWSASFTYPASLTLIAALDWLEVRAHGVPVAHRLLANELSDGINGSFYRGGPDPDHPEVPDGAIFITSLPTGASQTGNGNLDVIDVVTTSQGGLQVLLNPLPPEIGAFRKLLAQDRVNSFLGL